MAVCKSVGHETCLEAIFHVLCGLGIGVTASAGTATPRHLRSLRTLGYKQIGSSVHCALVRFQSAYSNYLFACNMHRGQPVSCRCGGMIHGSVTKSERRGALSSHGSSSESTQQP